MRKSNETETIELGELCLRIYESGLLEFCDSELAALASAAMVNDLCTRDVEDAYQAQISPELRLWQHVSALLPHSRSARPSA